ncbi:hemagglutinin [Microbacterium trichothecenolyticum]|uniref:hemagglutinin n=1 Tax=Microbacterium trichothecenolyticum TaxID=69370 RepID=UPI001C6F2380|nr:hemagglutinin [Microbacterium trichothecenolyticum]MBW9118547.1 hemagglutinin [Microbacterium trichothecenolyticum]
MSRNTRRRSIAAGITGCLVAAFVLGGASAATAADGPWEIDGIVIPDVTDPVMESIEDPFGNIKELGPLNSSTTKIGVIHNDALPTLGETNPNAQVDLRRAWVDAAKDAAGDDWLYFAWERDSANGSGFIAFEFMQNEPPAGCAYETETNNQLIANCNPWVNRQGGSAGPPTVPGDFMILWDQQGGSTALSLRIWSGTAPNLTLGAAIPLNATVSQAAYSPDKFKGEAAINLTDTVFGGVQQCLTIANVIPSTVTGNSDTADYKDTILAPAPAFGSCESTTETMPKTAAGENIPAGGLSIGTGVVGVKDSAVVDLTGGTTAVGGSVQFHLCKVDAPGLCTAGGTDVGSTDLTGETYPVTVVSPTAWVTAAGRYCWRAEYTPVEGTGVSGSSDARATECFTVNPVQPTLTTDASADVVLGGTVMDTATLDGTTAQPLDPIIRTGDEPDPGAPAGGTITFSLYGPSTTGCGPLVQTTSAVTVSGDGDYDSPTVTPTVAGTYHWVATYSGSSPNTLGETHNEDCTDGGEDVTVTTVASTLSSVQTWVPNDSVTLSAPAGGPMTGTVHIALYPNGTCSHAASPIYSDDLAVPGPNGQTVTTDNTTAVSASGVYSWEISYTSTNGAQRSIGVSCEETTALTIDNGDPVGSQ